MIKDLINSGLWNLEIFKNANQNKIYQNTLNSSFKFSTCPSNTLMSNQMNLLYN